MWKHSREFWKNQTWEAVAGSHPASNGNGAVVEKAELGEERSERLMELNPSNPAVPEANCLPLDF